MSFFWPFKTRFSKGFAEKLAQRKSTRNSDTYQIFKKCIFLKKTASMGRFCFFEKTLRLDWEISVLRCELPPGQLKSRTGWPGCVSSTRKLKLFTFFSKHFLRFPQILKFLTFFFKAFFEIPKLERKILYSVRLFSCPNRITPNSAWSSKGTFPKTLWSLEISTFVFSN